MRAEQHNGIMKALGTLAIALLVLSLSPSEGRALTGSEICAALGATDTLADSDGDGYTDFQECNGITFVGTSGGSFPGYASQGRPTERTGYLDPSGEDLFFFLVRATNSLIPAATPAGIYSIGLGVTTHEISSTNADVNRFVTSTQKAV